MSETLENMGLTEQEINKLKESKKQIILILDGYDEINKYKNIYQLSNIRQFNCKVIFTCRTQYLR